jgi:hypothetical protein
VFRYLFISLARVVAAQRRDLVDAIFKFFTDESKSKEYCFDLIEIPAIDFVRILSTRVSQQRPENRGLLQRLQGVFDSRNGLRFSDEASRKRILVATKEGIEKFK